MEIDEETVKHMALLSRIELSEEELRIFRSELAGILEYMKKLNELDISDVEATSFVSPMQNVMRADEVKPSLPLDEVLANAPDKEKGCFKVPELF